MPSPPATISTAEAREHFAEVLDRAAIGKERVVLTRRGKPLVALVPIEDVTALEALEDQRDSAEIRARMAEWRAEPHATPLAEVAARYGLKAGAARKARG